MPPLLKRVQQSSDALPVALKSDAVTGAGSRVSRTRAGNAVFQVRDYPWEVSLSLSG